MPIKINENVNQNYDLICIPKIPPKVIDTKLIQCALNHVQLNASVIKFSHFKNNNIILSILQRTRCILIFQLLEHIMARSNSEV